ncbi:MAG: PQQ-binding-like beta-propeller repeat protein [Chloroflexi bacterium]|nr:PQQ-binding-like beta-propeller repeat protein [Chloroflexota bacterium]MDA1241106.1 PQQ-binding-like beta-propeller repeat protein [Chloroflexota bacterium]
MKHQHSFHTINNGRSVDPRTGSGTRPRTRRGLVALVAGLALFLGGCVGIAQPVGWSQPVFSGETLLVQVAPGQVALIDPGTSATLWRFPDDSESSNPLYANPVIDGSSAYLAGYDGIVRRIDWNSGSPVQAWETRLDSRVVATPVLDGETLLVPTEDGRVERLNTVTGARAEAIRTGERRIWGSPVLAAGVLYVSDLDSGATVALDPRSGAEIWHQSAVGASAADLVVSGGMLYLASFDRAIHALDLGSAGAERWQFKGDGWFMAPPIVVNDVIYAATMRGTVYALDRETGAEQWKHTVTDAEFRASPVIVGGNLIVIGRKGQVTALDPSTGFPRWSSTIENAELNAHPTVRGTDIYLVTAKHEVLRVDTTNAGAYVRLAVSN